MESTHIVSLLLRPRPLIFQQLSSAWLISVYRHAYCTTQNTDLGVTAYIPALFFLVTVQYMWFVSAYLPYLWQQRISLNIYYIHDLLYFTQKPS